MNKYVCNNCGDIQYDPTKSEDLEESDLLCSICYEGFYEYKGKA